MAEGTPQHPWQENEHGMWCPCGRHIAANWTLDQPGFIPPDTCRDCGYPCFDDGPDDIGPGEQT